MSYSSTSAAATSSCVESGFDAQSTTSAPPAFSVRARLAVSVVTWRHAEMRWPASGCSLSKRSRMAASTGICRSAQAMRRTPSPARDRSFTSKRLVVAMEPLLWLMSGGQEPFLLALLPLDPRRRRCVRHRGLAREPRVHGGTKAWVVLEARDEGDVAD